MNEMTTTRTLEVIGAEIRAHATSMEFHMRGTVNEAIEIGRRLVEARDLAKHGEWMQFLESETPFSYDKANNLIKVFEAYGDQQKSLFGAALSNFDTYQNLSFSQALALLSVPEEERAEFAEENHVEDMTTRELQQAIRERDEAKKDAADSEKKLNELNQQFEQSQKALEEEHTKTLEMSTRIKELEERPVDVAVERDEAAIQKAADEARAAADAAWSKKLEAAKAALVKAEEKAKKAAEKAKSAGEDSEAEKYKAEAEQLRKQLAMSGEAVTTFKVHFETWQKAYQAMSDALAGADEETGGKLRAAIAAQMEAWKGGAV